MTTGGTETISHGLAEFVAQEEMAAFPGYWWSPDSRRIAFQESDASKVESWYVADPAQAGQPAAATFYPRPGKDNVACAGRRFRRRQRRDGLARLGPRKLPLSGQSDLGANTAR